MVESRQDKTNPCGRLVPSLERSLFTNLKNHLNVVDSPRSTPSLPFLWDNYRSNGLRILARLDRIYLFRNSLGCSQRKLLNYEIHSDTGWSDHCPITATVEFGATPSQPSRWKMSTQWLAAAKPEIEFAWTQAAPTAPFFAKMKAMSRAYRAVRCRKAQQFRAEEVAARTSN